ncbi:MAG: GNAT family N-acetyltransferase [Christensenellales bacterium]
MKNGLDPSLPHMGALMTRPGGAYPRRPLPEGFARVPWGPGWTAQWAALQHACGQVDSPAEGEVLFAREFLLGRGFEPPENPAPSEAAVRAALARPERAPYARQTARRVLLAADGQGRLAGCAALWPGRHFGRRRERVHFVAVRPDCQGRGLAQGLLTAVLDLAEDLGCGRELYLTTQTWSWPAVRLYRRYGFVPYTGPRPVNWITADPADPAAFARDNAAAWALIDGRIAAWEGQKRD